MAISNLTAKKILKSAGADRVSEDAAAAFADAINRFSYSAAKKAVKLSAHAKRSTVKKSDIQLAI